MGRKTKGTRLGLNLNRVVIVLIFIILYLKHTIINEQSAWKRPPYRKRAAKKITQIFTLTFSKTYRNTNLF